MILLLDFKFTRIKTTHQSFPNSPLNQIFLINLVYYTFYYKSMNLFSIFLIFTYFFCYFSSRLCFRTMLYYHIIHILNNIGVIPSYIVYKLHFKIMLNIILFYYIEVFFFHSSLIVTYVNLG